LFVCRFFCVSVCACIACVRVCSLDDADHVSDIALDDRAPLLALRSQTSTVLYVYFACLCVSFLLLLTFLSVIQSQRVLVSKNGLGTLNLKGDRIRRRLTTRRSK
jgi:hypothetical protein